MAHVPRPTRDCGTATRRLPFGVGNEFRAGREGLGERFAPVGVSMACHFTKRMDLTAREGPQAGRLVYPAGRG